MTLGKWRHLNRIVRYKCRLDVCTLALLTEDFVDEFALAHSVVYLDAEAAGGGAQLLFVHAGDVDTGVLLDSLCHSDTREGSLEADDIVAHLDLGGAVDIHTDFLQHVFGKVHHPVVVLVGHVYLHAGKLGVMGAIHTLVAEVLGELVHTLEAAYDKALEV